MKRPLKVVFFGSGRFAVAPLEALLNRPDDFTVQAVVCQPDRPAGRGNRQLTACPVAEIRRRTPLRLLQPHVVKGNDGFLEEIRALAPDLAIVAAYGKILPAEMLSVPRLGSLNLHASLLPKWRGASPIQAAIRAGDKSTGVSLMVMDAKMDHGPVLRRLEMEITPNDTYVSLETRLSRLAVDLLDSILKYADGELAPQEQDHQAATYCQVLTREDGRINWQEQEAAEILRMFRAYQPWPGIYTVWPRDDQPVRLKLLRIRSGEPTDLAPGTVTATADGDLAIAAADGRLIDVSEAQIEGKKACQGKAIACGYQKLLGSVL